MKIWQKIILCHHENAVIINSNQVKIPCIAYSVVDKTEYDDTITEQGDGYLIESFIHGTNVCIGRYPETSIKNYLGY